MDTHTHHDRDITPADRTPRGAPSPLRWLNLGILAHVDAGKTSLTEALLELGGAVAHRGRVDDGTTRTDTLAVERRRGITVRAAVATFHVGEVGINLVDTPGHPDFIAEVDRSLAVVDGAVLVVSAVEGVQAQTIVLARALRRLGVPTVVFVNKTDRMGADVDRTVAQVERRLGTPTVRLTELTPRDDPATSVRWLAPERVCAQLADHDDAVLGDWVRSGVPSRERLWRSLGSLTRRGTVTPAVCGSARTTAGVSQLIETILRVCPTSDAAAGDGPATGQVFAIERTARRARVCSVRLRTGTLTVRDHVAVGPGRQGVAVEAGRQATVTALEQHRPGGTVVADHATAGQIARVEGLESARIGDWIGPAPAGSTSASFPPPALQVTVTARDPGRQHDLVTALGELADIDPLIGLTTRGTEVSLTLYGTVQQEIVAETLSTAYGIEVVFGEPTVICLERPAGPGAAVLVMGEPDHLDMVTVGLTVEPAPPGTGVTLEVTADRGTLPLHLYGTTEGFRTALLGYVTDALARGPHGWPVTDLLVTVTRSGYPSGGPQAMEVRRTTVRVLEQALAEAGTVVCEPVDRIRVEVPTEVLSAVLNLLARHEAVPSGPTSDGDLTVVEAAVVTRRVDALRRELDGVTHGLGVLEGRLDHHVPVRGRRAF